MTRGFIVKILIGLALVVLPAGLQAQKTQKEGGKRHSRGVVEQVEEKRGEQKASVSDEQAARERDAKQGDVSGRKLAKQGEENSRKLAKQADASGQKLAKQEEENSRKLAKQGDASGQKLAKQEEENRQKLAQDDDVKQTEAGELRLAEVCGGRLAAYYDSIDAVAAEKRERKPVIGVSVSSTMKATCTRSIELAGGVPVILAVTTDSEVMDRMLDMLDGVMFSGGDDVRPSWYGEELKPECGSINDKRDYYELMLFKKAYDRGLPILGVCRGLQLINVAMGGTLYQDLPSELPSETHHGVYENSLVPAHDIRIEEGSLLSRLFDGATAYGVNSRHHQGIKDLAGGLHASAWSPDGVVEAIDAYPAHPILAFQFHPEINTAAGDETHLQLFRFFVEEALRYARERGRR